MVTFNVNGTPVCKGSLKAYIPKGWSRPIVTSTSKGLKPWEALVRTTAIIAGVQKAETGPMSVGLAFRLPRPKAMKAKAPITHDKQEFDIDKLSRAVLDALTGIAWHDDGQVDVLRAQKRYANPDEASGVTVFIKPTTHGD